MRNKLREDDEWEYPTHHLNISFNPSQGDACRYNTRDTL